MAEISGEGKAAGLAGGDSVVITEVPVSAAEGEGAGEAGEGTPTFETMGVTEEQFTKFFDADKGYNWQAHAKEAEYKAAQKTGTDPNDNTGDVSDDPNASQTPDPDAAAESAVAQAGLDMDGLGEQIRDYGDISQEDYDAFAKIGIAEEFVSDYVEMVKDRAEAHIVGVKDAFGGDGGWKDMQTWAQENLSQEDRDGYDAMLNSPKWKVAADTLRSQMGKPPVAPQGKLVSADNQASPNEASGNAFADQNAMNTAIQDPKYKTDPAYRADVMRRAAASNWETNARAHTAGL